MVQGARLKPSVAVVALFVAGLGACRDRAATGSSTSTEDAGDASLAFKSEGKELRRLSIADLARDVPPETFTAYDPYYVKKKTYRALPLRAVLERGLAGAPGRLEDHDYVLRARDGYTVPLQGTRLLEPGAYLAIADVSDGATAWQPIGPQQANPGPVYLVWKGEAQQDLETHPRPWQLASIEIARFEDTFPHVVPTGEAAGSPAMRGLATFRAQCIHCHAVNREGGRVGPELNVPQSIVEYRPEAQIRAYIVNPLAFRYGNMPAHPNMTDKELDELLAYFRAMKERKYVPDGGAR